MSSDLRVCLHSSPTIFVFYYGRLGDLTARTMYESLSKRSLGLLYDPHFNRFTILGSAAFQKEEIEKIFAENVYRILQPNVLNELDKSGDHFVQLVWNIPKPSPKRALSLWHHRR